MEFWYRQSPRQFEPVAFWEWSFPRRVTEERGECLLTSAAAGLEPFVRRGRSGSGEVVGSNTAMDPADLCRLADGVARLTSRASQRPRTHRSGGLSRQASLLSVCRTLDQTWPHEIVRAYAWN